MRKKHDWRKSLFKYLGWDLDESGTELAECRKKVASGRKVASVIRPLVDAMGLQLQCEWVLHEGLFMPVPLYGSGTMVWKEKERSRIRAMPKDNLKSVIGIKRMARVLNVRIRDLCGVVKVVDERIAESIF